ncbi:hypothetical protein [Streptomyces virginiae]|uniref:hypothetical protein n=1 Tax=Streptomyces virginiae TaxID=1961 RepID=UPI00225BA0B3|nr:hypothetical protein [Streptomyces virginiae]MCX5278023.1 hypothetical protein [Streptomyces virginiae]
MREQQGIPAAHAVLRALHDPGDHDAGLLDAVARIVAALRDGLYSQTDDQSQHAADWLEAAEGAVQDAAVENVDRAREELAPPPST